MLIVDDHPVFREALKGVVAEAKPDWLIHTAEDMAEARARMDASVLDLAILDLWLPDVQGYEALVELRNAHPKLPVIIMSAFSDRMVVHKAMVLGAAGFIAKSARRNDIVAAIDAVMKGDVAVPDGYRPPDAPCSEELAALSRRIQTLTPQQLRVLHMICQGQLNKEIAYAMDIRETTVKAHISQILRKLAVATRTQAVIEVSKLDLDAVSALYLR